MRRRWRALAVLWLTNAPALAQPEPEPEPEPATEPQPEPEPEPTTEPQPEPEVLPEPRPAATPTADPGAEAEWFREAEKEHVDREAHRHELEANYRRNKLGLSLALRRASVKISRKEYSSWGGAAAFEFIIPLRDGVSPMWIVGAGFEAYPVDDGTLGTMAASFAYGLRTPAFMGYLGGIFGAALPIGDLNTEGGYLFGALAGLGVDFGRVNLRAEGRWEKGLFRAGATATVLSISPVLGITF